MYFCEQKTMGTLINKSYKRGANVKYQLANGTCSYNSVKPANITLILGVKWQISGYLYKLMEH